MRWARIPRQLHACYLVESATGTIFGSSQIVIGNSRNSYLCLYKPLHEEIRGYH